MYEGQEDCDVLLKVDVLELLAALPRYDEMLDVDLDGRCGCSSAIDALNCDCETVYDECQDDAKSDEVDVKQVLEQFVGNDADLTAKMM